MSGRWFASSVRVGAIASAAPGPDGRAQVRPSITMTRTTPEGGHGDEITFPAPGAAITLPLIGPGDVFGFDRGLVARQEPPDGCVNAATNELASVEFAHADLPWQLSPPGAPPWLALVVLREDEGVPAERRPLPVVTIPPQAQPDLARAAMWAHVEARLTGEDDLGNRILAGVRRRSDAVIARLVCPRRLEEDTPYVACVVPATAGGREAGLTGRSADPRRAAVPAWTAGAAPVEMPVYYWWRFRTGPDGSFEALARRLVGVDPSTIEGFGVRTVSVRRPWPHREPPEGTPPSVTASIQGALRIPGSEVADEVWEPASPAQETFMDELLGELNAPGRRFDPTRPPPEGVGPVTPPLYGSHFTGLRRADAAGWQTTLNLQVRYRVAASLGARYVQLEQEFLMARAWEQAGPIREAARMVAAAELAAESGRRVQDKHLTTMDQVAFTSLSAPLGGTLQIELGFERTGEPQPLGDVVDETAVPGGAFTTAFARLTRRGGGLARRSARAAQRPPQEEAALAAGLEGTRLLGPPASCTEATGDVSALGTRQTDPVGAAAAGRLAMLMDGELSQCQVRGDYSGHADFAGFGDAVTAPDTSTLGNLTQTLAGETGTSERTVVSSGWLRGLRRTADFVSLDTPQDMGGALGMGAATLADAIRTEIEPVRLQLARVQESVFAPGVQETAVPDPRPLRPIMAHPSFDVPMAVELFRRWPEWALPGIGGLPEDSVVLLETNPAFVEAFLVGLNDEFNRELRWREYPTDERGTAFARFWSSPDQGLPPDIDEIARWPLGTPLGGHDRMGGRSLLTLLVRGEVLRRFQGTVIYAVQAAEDGTVPPEGAGVWIEPAFAVPADESTNLYAFETPTREQVAAGGWLFVIREPMRGTRFGFDDVPASGSPPPLTHWSDLTWAGVPVDGRGFVVPHRVGDEPPTPGEENGTDPAWGRDAADIARIAFQQPFQLAYRAEEMLPGG
ncbi:hypothetical protein E1287_05020 [Actinomadura sp. KC06]|uniref:hypothetical protein n=1 Tax=Actinomadura sp. KC06 TaxID=2530369 RepID=UPI001046311F|nr:hypothetical protein [Actinomadura sp. KC06]TDD38646.1 hypothetical protein E1287_05020 [Actinomadura sp. KC06]